MPPPSVGQPVPSALADASVLDADGGAHRLGDSWANGACLLSFLRHFGCTGCSEHVTELVPSLHELAQLGVRTVFVGSGEPRYIAGFVERLALGDKDVTVLTDPGLAAFGAAGLVRSLWATFGPVALADQVRELVRGHPHRGIEGDALQQGGEIVIDASGTVVFYHRSASVGGHAPVGDLVDAALRIAASRTEVRV